MSPGKPKPFTRLVVIRTGIPPRLRRIGTVREAVEAMLEWPEHKRGPAFGDAAKACHDAFIGKAASRAALVRAAREAFVAAAEEAGIFVREEDKGSVDDDADDETD